MKYLILFFFSSFSHAEILEALAMAAIGAPVKPKLQNCTISCHHNNTDNTTGGGGGTGGQNLTSYAQCRQDLKKYELQNLVHFCLNSGRGEYTFKCTANWGKNKLDLPERNFNCY
jgi:hypothetical protein